MKKYTYYLVLFSMMFFGQLQASVFPNFSQSISLSNYLSTPDGSGYGSISVTNDVLTVSISGGWTTAQTLKTGIILTLTVSPGLPDTELGTILTSAGSYAGCWAKIQGNNLVIYSIGTPSVMTSCSLSFTKSLVCTTTTTWYADNDLDGLGDPLKTLTSCSSSQPAGNWVLNNTDSCPLINGTSANCAGLEIVSQEQNYIKTTTYKVPSTTTISSPTKSQANQNITYFDGLGRPIQQIANQQSVTGKDIITHIEYDAFGRQPKDYLPYASGSNTGMTYDRAATANVLNYTPYVGQNPFSEKAFEASPLNRVLKQAAPGSVWKLGNGHEIKLNYQTNIASEVKLFSVTATQDASSGLYNIGLINNTGTVFYIANQLYKTIAYDENTASTPTEANGSTVEFKNKEGKVVLKRTYESGAKHDTYYVYDQYGNLTYVIPPKADGTITQAILDDLCYQYKYDYRNRLAEKKLPGKQWEFIVYDKLDRVVATGPAFSPFSDITLIGWLITKYDALNRVVYTGWENTSASSTTRASKQTNQNNLTTTLNESKGNYYGTTIDNIPAIYSNEVAPTSFKLLSVNYYDDYSIPDLLIFPTSTAVQGLLYKQQGLNTGTWTRILTTTASVSGEISATFYDAKARPIRTTHQNYLGGYTYIDSKLDAFSGQLQYTVTKHKRQSTDTEILVKEEFTYSPQDRLLTHTHQINSLPVQLLASNTYDELEQLISKNVGNNTTMPLQKVDYSYNIRGWLTGINNDPTNNLVLNTTEKDLFAFKINYNTTEANVAIVKPLYNGNISETYWRIGSDNVLRKYGYEYDNLNRLKNAIYQKPGGNTYPTYEDYSEKNISYDKNGNIQTLIRNGDVENALPANGIDNLVYTYTTNTNRLQNVIDNTNNTSGFNDGNKSSVDYTYDLNGNLKTDVNKGITNIVYNHLNLPVLIEFNNSSTKKITYLYNASGVKIRKWVYNSNYIPTRTEYLDGFQYKDESLQYFPTAEGYVNNTVISGVNTFKYVFNYTDHLGNIRLSYQDTDNNGTIANSEFLEENNYYPFGLKHKNYNTNNYQPTYKYKYNGKELQDELGLNVTAMDYRQYDMAIGRFNSMDRLSELAYDISPYRFGLNNPIAFSDPTGLFETRKEAREYRREHRDEGVRGGITKNNDGSFSINDKENHISYFKPEKELEVSTTNSDGVAWSPLAVGKPKTESQNLDAPWTSLSNTLIGGGFGGFVGTLSIQAEKASINYVAKYGSQLESAVDITLKNRLFYAKLAKGAGRIATGVSIATTLYSGYSVYHQYKTGGINNVNGLDVADTTFGVVGLAGTALTTFGLVSNPVGWGIGAAVIIYGGIRLVQDINNKE